MKRLLCALLLLPGCEPSLQNRSEGYVGGLADLYAWDPVHQGEGQYAYDEIMLMGRDAYDSLVDHLIDDTPTKIMDSSVYIPTVGDVCFQILCRMTRTRPGDYRKEGVVVLSGVGNPLYATRFDAGARERLQERFRK